MDDNTRQRGHAHALQHSELTCGQCLGEGHHAGVVYAVLSQAAQTEGTSRGKGQRQLVRYRRRKIDGTRRRGTRTYFIRVSWLPGSALARAITPSMPMLFVPKFNRESWLLGSALARATAPAALMLFCRKLRRQAVQAKVGSQWQLVPLPTPPRVAAASARTAAT